MKNKDIIIDTVGKEVKCDFCDRPAYKTNGKSEWICQNRAETGRCDRKGFITSYGPLRRKQPKIGRNQECLCGSGKKYKKCHGVNN